jgi:hypothetical protein
MKARVISSLAAAGVLALVGCSQDRSTPASFPTEASFAKGGPPSAPTCSFTKATQDGKGYFARQKDSVYNYLDLLQAATKGTDANAINDAGFRVLARLGVATDSGLVNSAADSIGSVFANDVLLCTTIGGYGTDFKASLGPSGLFAVRAVGDLAPVTSRSTVTPPGVPVYGAEPTTSTGWQFTGSTTNKALFYASPVTSSIADPTVGTVFDLSTLPTPLTFSPRIRVGVCDMTIADGRIEHVHGSPVILPPDVPSFCTPSQTGVESSASMFASAAQRVVSWLAPRPAYASTRSMMFAFFGGGGLVSGLSEIGPVQVIDTVSFPRIGKAKVSQTTNQFSPAISVFVRTTAGTPLAGVTVTLTVANNSGSFTPPSDSVAVTNASGIATYPNFYLNKAGGYTITATTEFGTTGVSNLFNVSGQ